MCERFCMANAFALVNSMHCNCHDNAGTCAAAPLLQHQGALQFSTSFQDDGSEQGTGYTCLSATPDDAALDSSHAAHEAGTPAQAANAVSAVPEVLAFVAEHLLQSDTEAVGAFADSFVPLCAHDVATLAASALPTSSLLQVRLHNLDVQHTLLHIARWVVVIQNFWINLMLPCLALQSFVSDHQQASQCVMQAAKAAEQTLHQQGHVRADSTAWTALSQAVAPLEAAQFDELQADTLQRLRDMCIGSQDWSDTLGSADIASVGDRQFSSGDASTACGWPWPGLFAGGRMLVWRCAVDMAALLEAAVAEVHQDVSSLRVGVTCKTLGDAAALYDALVLRPSSFNMARRALIHVNSLQHLADAIALLPLTVAAHDAAVDDISTAAATAAAAFAASADEQQAAFVKRLGGIGRKVLHELPPLLRLDRSGGLAARKRVQKCCAVLRTTAEALAACCRPAEQVALFCRVLGDVCDYAARKVLELRDISPQDCDEIKAIFERLWTDAPAAAATQFLQDAPGGDGALGRQWPQHVTADTLAEVLRQACQPVRKLMAVGSMLSDRMVDIAAAWESGALPATGLTAAEVTSMMRAIFEDNPHRRNCIERVEAAA